MRKGDCPNRNTPSRRTIHFAPINAVLRVPKPETNASHEGTAPRFIGQLAVNACCQRRSGGYFRQHQGFAVTPFPQDLSTKEPQKKRGRKGLRARAIGTNANI